MTPGALVVLADMAGKKAKEKGAPSGASTSDPKATLDAFYAEHGPGHNTLEDFVFVWELYRYDPSQENLERLEDHVELLASGIAAYLSHKHKTLDEAFQVKRPTNYHRAAAQKRFDKMKNLQDMGAHLRRHGAVADEAFFKLLGDHFNVGKTQASEWYYLKHRGLQPDPRKSSRSIPEWARQQLNWLDSGNPQN